MQKVKTIENSMLSAVLVILLSFLSAGIIFYGSNKVIATVILLPLLGFFYINASPFAKIVLPLIMITFPITLQAFGKDAFSTGTILIFFSIAWALTKYKFSLTFAKDKFFISLLILIAVIAFIGMSTKTPNNYWGPAIRHYLNLVSSIAVFVLIIHGQRIRDVADNSKDYIEKILTVLLTITVMHIFISLLIFNFPWVEKSFEIFLKRGQEHLGGNVVQGIYTRAASVFTGGEELGELMVLLFPFALYKIFSSTNKIYIFIVLSLLIGVVVSGTRSAFLLILLQTIGFVYFFAPAQYNRRKIAVTLTFCFIGLILMPFFDKYGPILFDRMQETLINIAQKEDIDVIANRYGVWPVAYKITTNTLSLFGHGPVQAHVIGFPARNFHNLYLTLLFQFGIGGAMVFMIFFGTILKRLFAIMKQKFKTEKTSQSLLATACLLSLSCFLINEFKYEFNRSDSYQQFVWCIFAVYYLTGALNEEIKKKHQLLP